jgi:precorrin-8X/cobalt-precorrin-8 methylmutase
MTPEEIYAESFRIIEAEAGGHTFDAMEWPVVRRMVHASGDLEILRCVVFTGGAVAAGVAALRDGVAIVADVGMVAAGISKPHATALGVALRCFIDDPDVREQAAARGLTRSACAMAKAVAEVGDAVYVVGNAPTALLALCDAVREGVVRPRLVVAMPVGFVSVVESKERALSLSGTPVAAVRGRKGGSAVAAAAVNAMLRMATREPLP